MFCTLVFSEMERKGVKGMVRPYRAHRIHKAWYAWDLHAPTKGAGSSEVPFLPQGRFQGTVPVSLFFCLSTGEGCCARCGRPSLTFGTNAPDGPATGLTFSGDSEHQLRTALLRGGRVEGKRKELHFKSSICLLVSKEKKKDRQNTLKFPDFCFYKISEDSL